MKNDIHPKYFPNAKFHCACGQNFDIGATKEKVNVEICSHCHPFYTGKSKLVDIAGRVERFKARKAKATATVRKKTIKKAAKKAKRAK